LEQFVTSQQAPMPNPKQTGYMGSKYVKVWCVEIVARKKTATPKSLADWQKCGMQELHGHLKFI
jgi:hypothetical protein